MRVPIPPFIGCNLCSENFRLWRWFWIHEMGQEPLGSSEERLDFIGGWYYEWRNEMTLEQELHVSKLLR